MRQPATSAFCFLVSSLRILCLCQKVSSVQWMQRMFFPSSSESPFACRFAQKPRVSRERTLPEPGTVLLSRGCNLWHQSKNMVKPLWTSRSSPFLPPNLRSNFSGPCQPFCSFPHHLRAKHRIDLPACCWGFKRYQEYYCPKTSKGQQFALQVLSLRGAEERKRKEELPVLCNVHIYSSKSCQVCAIALSLSQNSTAYLSGSETWHWTC